MCMIRNITICTVQAVMEVNIGIVTQEMFPCSLLYLLFSSFSGLLLNPLSRQTLRKSILLNESLFSDWLPVRTGSNTPDCHQKL